MWSFEVGGKHCNVLADGEPVANLFTVPLSLSTLMRDVAMDAPGLPEFVYLIHFVCFLSCPKCVPGRSLCCSLNLQMMISPYILLVSISQNIQPPKKT